MKIPNTPFSTRLSGSAKETELRLRSIFQWKKKRPPVVLFVLTALVVLRCFGLFSCVAEEPEQDEQNHIAENTFSPDEPAENGKQGEVTVAPINGETLSHDGAYEVRLSGVIEGVSTDGLAAAEFVQICDTRTGEVLWQGNGAYEHAVVWSPDGKKLALARTTRTGSTVTIVEAESWTAWDVTIPGKDSWDQISIPEYTYLPDNGDWFEWFRSETFRLTLGRGGDAGNRNDYYGSIYKGVPLDGKTLYLEEESIPSEYDLNHDGSPERLEKLTIQETADGVVQFFLLRVIDEDGTCLWAGDAGAAHAAWNTYFVCSLEGQDYLLEYDPYMSGGVGYYSYRLFYLDSNGEEVLCRENTLDFDINPASKFMNHNFNADTIANFVDEVNELLAHSKLLLTTDGAVRDMNPDEPYETLWHILDDITYGYDETKTLRENLEVMEAFLASI